MNEVHIVQQSLENSKNHDEFNLFWSRMKFWMPITINIYILEGRPFLKIYVFMIVLFEKNGRQAYETRSCLYRVCLRQSRDLRYYNTDVCTNNMKKFFFYIEVYYYYCCCCNEVSIKCSPYHSVLFYSKCFLQL